MSDISSSVSQKTITARLRKQCKALAAELGCTIITSRRGRGMSTWRVEGPAKIYGWQIVPMQPGRSTPSRAGWRCYGWDEVEVALRTFRVDMVLMAYGLDHIQVDSLLQVAADHPVAGQLLETWAAGKDDFSRLALADWLEDRYNEHDDQVALALAEVLRAAPVPDHMRPAQETPEQVEARLNGQGAQAQAPAARTGEYGAKRSKDLPWSTRKVAIFRTLRRLYWRGQEQVSMAELAAEAELRPVDARHYTYHGAAGGLCELVPHPTKAKQYMVRITDLGRTVEIPNL